ncbi:class I SAM-dependent methyltransferase [Nodosilinea sp. LEGE 07298]|uniref:class I SAM-dependent methyltransferase n=1 Tax=Nodosilinea sp. LEGE 07298 TaxID=2777970 RepID=UPI001881D907|nr:class I SAM-dependent methyltransferase [Nodosilinea sp. LEGE 07298]MBE9109134.1 class I SAM-dependent methyltransferase [Nodosilinea sp. LEGE 07298]
METKIDIDSFQEDLRPGYDFHLPSLTDASNSRGLVFKAIVSGSHVLDVGCDTGRFGEVLRKQKYCTVDGIEPCARAAQLASSRLDKIFIQPVENERSFEEFENYDAVLFLDVLEHLVDPWSVLEGAKKALKPGGAIYVVVPNIAHISIVRRLVLGDFEYQKYGTMDKTHLRWFTRKSLQRALEDAGFINIKIDGLTSIPYLGKRSNALRFIENQLGRLFPNMFSGSILGHGQVYSSCQR